jgi:alpha-galactosidase
MPKIALIGAGSVVFARTLISDILTFPELRDSTIALMDINPERLGLITALAQRMVDQEGAEIEIQSTLDRCEALRDADYVIIMIQAGGLAMYEVDVKIPLRYGIDQTVGDTLGPGGVFRGLRTIPVLLDICRDMRELCPEALLINYANPMAINCWAINEAGGIRNVGLCHSVQGTARQLAQYVGAPYEEVIYWVAGINHMAWVLEFRWRGKDAYPLLRAKLEDPEWGEDGVRFEVMRHFDYFVTESTHHMSEYVPYFRQRKELIEQFDSPRWDYLELCQTGWQPHYERIRRQIAGEEPIEIRRSHEYGTHIIHSLETNTLHRVNANVENAGLITNLPRGCCVEVPCLVDGTGVRPCYVGDLPFQCAALNRSSISLQELALKAALIGDRRAAFQAVALDPLTAAMLSLWEIQQIVDELFEAEAEWLPQFD